MVLVNGHHEGKGFGKSQGKGQSRGLPFLFVR